jgi:hypothetical protein
MPFLDAQCYSNGIDVSSSVDISTGAITLKFMKNHQTCLEEDGTLDLSGGNSSTLTLKDGSGKTIATATGDSNGNTVISCGGQTYTLDSSCPDPTQSGDMSGNSNCTMGACTP